MKIINTGNRYEIYDDNLKTYDALNAQTYIVRFSKLSGFYLERYPDMEIKESKVYGIHGLKVDKVLNSFRKFDRNLGVILSGEKGIGKSLFAKMLSIKAIEEGMPVIIVDTCYPGIASYIEQIAQEVIVLFDEFDKTFGGVKSGDNEASPQTGLLTLFDGISPGKKMFVITCNDLGRLNDYLVNRPGRFHYHFRFDYPTAEEIRIYLKDKLEPEYYDEIEKVVIFSSRINLNYDCLRAISFELNNGEKFEDAIKDLNIIRIQNEPYDITAFFENGIVMSAKDECLDLFDKNEIRVWIYGERGISDLYIKFDTQDIHYSNALGKMIVRGECVRYSFDQEDLNYSKCNDFKLNRIELIRSPRKNIHYLV